MARPVICIVSNFSDGDSGPPCCKLNAAYADAIWSAGGLPVILPPTEDVAAIRQFLDVTDGLMFGGGPDVVPARYGQAAHSATRPMASRLDGFLFAVCEQLPGRPLPVLGICLGAQVLNVARGGTLLQHLPDMMRANPLRHAPGGPGGAALGTRAFHAARIEPGSLLRRLLGADRIEVNSTHHQAVDRVGAGLVVSARSDDGVVEAVEDPLVDFFLAVQWHPENLTGRAEHAALFAGLVSAAERARSCTSH